jgi:dienelactone hydrolase
MPEYTPEAVHEHIAATMPRALGFDPSADLDTWRTDVKAKLTELVGVMPDVVPLNVTVEWEKEHDDFREIRFHFTAEAEAEVPCHLLVPLGGDTPHPAVICLQGHSTGMHISLGRPKYEGDEEAISGGDRDFAIRTVREGYAALVMEQRCFGERLDSRENRSFDSGCRHSSSVSLLLGRTMIGERVWDVSRAIDALGEFSEIDISRIGCMGNSGGGTITYFATCLEPRISIAMPSCYVCTFWDSIGRIDHCDDNYIPGALRWFEMGDLAGLIAPRPMVVVAGRHDGIFPVHAVEKTFETIRSIYDAAGVGDRCRLVIGAEGHRFYADQAWPLFHELAQW